VEKEARFTIEINLLGTMRVTHGLLDFILESKGCIINIASIFGRIAPPGSAIYAASKHGTLYYSFNHSNQ
jgi:short-subunit dehydrogenase